MLLSIPRDSGLAPPVILIAALVLDALLVELGPVFRILPHPVALVGGLTGWLDRRLNRERRSTGTRLARGIAVTVLMAAPAGVRSDEHTSEPQTILRRSSALLRSNKNKT